MTLPTSVAAQRPPRPLRTTTVATPVGPFTVVVDGACVVAAGFASSLDGLAAAIGVALPAEPVTEVGTVGLALRDYLDGDLAALDAVEVRQPGGPFAQAAWQAMRGVPAGSTASYRALAAAAGRPAAVRAAGAACAGNDVSLFVPCHRIVRTGGALGGYLWGLPVKRWLLDHEGCGRPGWAAPGPEA